jgi:hypothetical protein
VRSATPPAAAASRRHADSATPVRPPAAELERALQEMRDHAAQSSETHAEAPEVRATDQLAFPRAKRSPPAMPPKQRYAERRRLRREV